MSGPQSTTKTIALTNPAGQLALLAPRYLSSAVAPSGVYRNLVGIDLGAVPTHATLDPRSRHNGYSWRGQFFSMRRIGLLLSAEVNTSLYSGTAVEAIRDQEIAWWATFLQPAGVYAADALMQLTLYRSKYPVNQLTDRVIACFVSIIPSWRWEPDGAGLYGLQGLHSQPEVLIPLLLTAPDPWWKGENTNYTDIYGGSPPTQYTITVVGDVPCGLTVWLFGTGAGDIRIRNITNAVPEYVRGPGLTLTGINLSAGPIEIVFDETQALSPRVTQAGSDLRSHLSLSSDIQLVPGDNILESTVLSGTLAGDIEIYWDGRFAAP